LHGDHFFGLIGLISTFSLLNRESDLHIFAPAGAKEIINLQLELTNSWVQYPIHFHELKSKKSELIFEDENVEVLTIPLKHRIYTNGFLFKEKEGERKLNMAIISQEKEIEICDYQNLKNGKDFIKANGKIIANENLTFDPPAPLSYAFCSDTSYSEAIIPVIKNVDLLYHEATFLEDNLELAKKTKHSTALQAAQIAKKSEAKKLILGHYSSRYKNLEDFKTEAKTLFNAVELAEEGKIFTVEN
jgi:ribonuclease Z